MLWQEGTQNVTVANNVFWRNQCDSCPTAVHGLNSGGGHVLRNNVYDNPQLADGLGDFVDEDNRGDDAMLGGDYELGAQSPAIGAGSLVDAPTHDLKQRVRDPASNDAGAFQYCP